MPIGLVKCSADSSGELHGRMAAHAGRTLRIAKQNRIGKKARDTDI